MIEPPSPTRFFADHGHTVSWANADSGSIPSHDELFGQMALRSGLIDLEMLRTALQQAMDRKKSLAEILVENGSLSEKARQGIQLLIEEQFSQQGYDPQASLSSVVSFSTASLQPAMPDVTPQPMTRRMFGHYELIEEVARGGMGIVYKARQIGLNRLVALKMIRSGGFASAQDVKRFYAEAEAAAKLDHPGIVPVFEVGEIEGQHFFSMAFVQGQSLSNRVKTDGPFEPRLAARLLRTIAEAVHYAHAQGIVHRDIKPHNILLDEGGQPRIADFGLAKRVQETSDLTTTGQVMGTPSYMPPEQASGNIAAIGPAADIYSLGATLYCLLTGRPPFQASSTPETIRQVLDDQPAPLHRLNPEIPRDLETICLKCLRKEIGQRYGSAQELANDLARFNAGEPIHARPVGRWERGVKWVRRRPIAAVSVVAAVAIIAACVSVAYQVRLSGLNETLESKNRDLDAAQKSTAAARDEATTQRDAADRAKKLLARHRYASDIAIAGRAWREGDVSRMLSLLDHQIPKPCEEDLRGFEWYYLRGQERCDLWRADAGYACLSPNGNYLAVSASGRVQLLDPRTRQVIRECTGIDPDIARFAFSRDSRRLIAGIEGREAMVWDVEKGTEISRLRATDMLADAVILSADGMMAATSGTGTDHSVRLWDVTTGKQTHLWKIPGSYGRLGEFSPDSKHLAFIERSAIVVHDLQEKKLAYTITVAPLRIKNLTYHPTGTLLIAACEDNTVLIWDARTGQEATSPAFANKIRGNAIAISPDGKLVITGVTDDNSVRLWEATTGKQLSSRKGHPKRISQVFLQPHGDLGLSLGEDNSIRLWNLRGVQESQELPGSLTTARAVRFSPADSNILGFIEGGGKIMLSDGQRHRALQGQDQLVSQFAFSPDGNQLAGVPHNGSVFFWEVATGKRLHALQEPTGGVNELVYNHAGTVVATVSFDHTIRVWDAKTGKQLHQFPAPKTNNGVVRLYFQPGTDYLISAQAFEGYQIIRLGETPRMETIRDKMMTYHLTFSPDGSRIAAAGPGGFHVTVWTFPEFEQVHVLQGHMDGVMNFRFSPDGRVLGTISIDKTIKLWDMESGQELLTLASPPSYDLAFSHDGRRIAASGNGSAIQIWDSAKGYPSTIDELSRP